LFSKPNLENSLLFLQGSNKLSQKLLLSLNDSGFIHMVPSMVNDIYIIRFAVCAKYANADDMHVAFRIIEKHADDVLAEYRALRNGRHSSSNDSLDLAAKQAAAINNAEQDTAVSEETVDPEALAETPIAPIICPATKSRVNKRIILLFPRETFYNFSQIQ
jgi:hypothetical protein